MDAEHHHDLAHEFPEFKQRIHELKLASPAFKRLYDDYQAMDKALYRIGENIETPSDDYTEELKRKRVWLKDRLYGMLTGRIPAVAATVGLVTRHKFVRPVDHSGVVRDWIARGYSCRGFTDPPGREWRDFVHDTNELVTVVDGRLEVSMHGESYALEPGDELFIPRGVAHTVRNIHASTTHWLYGYD
ncbi:MAG TPA: cupin domain-containing protein [Candidatus Methylomirabilis sp.]|nr:cupin domain-containing protein [Candidatus Methylomirabilis sp.]